ncbi:twin-arginine translocation signal domain-containing protein [Natrialbaceae archaeon GCM10025810]|uniref:twin-arginine translocation signal domain-containing protein n=1 Tax=Halovalidus salilacus TaxID=3075124 RepID=UPI0036214C40
MNRRRFLGVTAGTAGLAGLAGCSGVLRQDMYEPKGSSFVSIDDIDDGFSGTLRVVPSCRDEAVDIPITNGEPQGSISYTRQERGEECSFDLYIDDEQTETLTISGTEECSIQIDEEGNIDFECMTI